MIFDDDLFFERSKKDFSNNEIVVNFSKAALNFISSENRDVYFMLGLHSIKAKG